MFQGLGEADCELVASVAGAGAVKGGGDLGSVEAERVRMAVA